MEVLFDLFLRCFCSFRWKTTKTIHTCPCYTPRTSLMSFYQCFNFFFHLKNNQSQYIFSILSINIYSGNKNFCCYIRIIRNWFTEISTKKTINQIFIDKLFGIVTSSSLETFHRLEQVAIEFFHKYNSKILKNDFTWYKTQLVTYDDQMP